jgi:hypothetical protein
MNIKKKKVYSRLVVCLLFCIVARPVGAQYKTKVSLISGAPNQHIKTAMEENGTLLLTEFNNAQGQKRSLSLKVKDKEIAMNYSAFNSLQSMWAVCPFRCDELEIVERCLQTYSGGGGWQIRNIPVIMEPGAAGGINPNNKYQELVINFDHGGNIRSVTFALESNWYRDLMEDDGNAVTDLRERSMVVEFVEQFRTAYNRKDLPYLQDIYSDDALIITGKVERDGPGLEARDKTRISYISQTKKEYLKRLAKVFESNARINVVFEDVRINKHRTKKYYGVKLVQHWNSGSYSDIGYLFLLWDFTKSSEEPKVLVRTWQPYKETPKDKLFDIVDFMGD